MDLFSYITDYPLQQKCINILSFFSDYDNRDCLEVLTFTLHFVQDTILHKNFPEAPSSSSANFLVHHQQYLTTRLPITMAHQPDADAVPFLQPSPSTLQLAWSLTLTIPYSSKQWKIERRKDIFLTLQFIILPKAPSTCTSITVATAARTVHPDAPPTKNGHQQLLQQIKQKKPLIQPCFCSLHSNPIFLPLGSKLILNAYSQQSTVLSLRHSSFILQVFFCSMSIWLFALICPHLCCIKVSSTEQKIRLPDLCAHIEILPNEEHHCISV